MAHSQETAEAVDAPVSDMDSAAAAFGKLLSEDDPRDDDEVAADGDDEQNSEAGDDEPADDLFLVFNAGGDCAFTLPAVNRIEQWQRIADTGAEEAFSIHPVEGAAMVYGASVAVFCPMTKEIEQAGGKSERRRWFHLGRLLGR